MPPDLAALETAIGIAFRDRRLLRTALTHRSYLNEVAQADTADNERLEFLGDALVDFVAADHLYRHLPEAREGTLTTLRAALVRESALAGFARAIGLGGYLRLGRGEEASGGRTRPTLLCDAFEALVGAIYLDHGLAMVERFVVHFIEPELEAVLARAGDRDAKSLFQELAQRAWQTTPRYVTVSASGPDHAKSFVVQVLVGDTVWGRVPGRRRPRPRKPRQRRPWSGRPPHPPRSRDKRMAMHRPVSPAAPGPATLRRVAGPARCPARTAADERQPARRRGPGRRWRGWSMARDLAAGAGHAARPAECARHRDRELHPGGGGARWPAFGYRARHAGQPRPRAGPCHPCVLDGASDPGGEIVGVGGGVSWLDALDEGESGPFSVGVRFCCLPDIGAYDLTTSADAAPAPRYHDLAVLDLNEQVVDGEGRVYGWLRNTGDAFLNASSTDVYAGFWHGDDLVELQTARLPVFYTPDAPTGQSHPPGVAYPWAIAFPDVQFDWYQVWTYAEPFPPGLYPIPLAADAVTARRVAADIVVAGTLRSCGTAAAGLVVVVVEATAADGSLVEFGRAVLALDDPLDPGERQGFSLTWPNVRPAVDAARVTATAYAVDTQAVRPTAVPCAGLRRQGFLPALTRSGDDGGSIRPSHTPR